MAISHATWRWFGTGARLDIVAICLDVICLDVLHSLYDLTLFPLLPFSVRGQEETVAV